jgi:abortive infection bacteriophage resistance protein
MRYKLKDHVTDEMLVAIGFEKTPPNFWYQRYEYKPFNNTLNTLMIGVKNRLIEGDCKFWAITDVNDLEEAKKTLENYSNTFKSVIHKLFTLGYLEEVEE